MNKTDTELLPLFAKLLPEEVFKNNPTDKLRWENSWEGCFPREVLPTELQHLCTKILHGMTDEALDDIANELLKTKNTSGIRDLVCADWQTLIRAIAEVKGVEV